MRWNPSRLLFTSVLVTLLGIASGYGQELPPTLPGPTIPTTQLPPGREELQTPPHDGISDRPQSPLIQQRVEPSPNLILRSLLGRQSTSPLFMQLSLTEEYSDNFNQENENSQDESQTTLTLGTRYRLQGKRRFLALANTLEARYQARQQSFQLGVGNTTLDMGYDFPRLSLSLSDTFVRSDDPEEASTIGAPRERSTFWRNSVAPRVRFQLSRLSSLDLVYTNVFIVVEEGNQDDSVTDQLQATLQQQFTRKLRGSLNCSFVRNDDSSRDPEYEYTLAADATYDLTRRLSLIATIFWSYNNREPADTDSLRYGGDFSIKYRLLPDLSLVIGAGASLFDDEVGDLRIFPTWQLGLDGTLQIVRGTRLRFTSEQRMVNTQGEVEDVGIVLQQVFSARLEQDILRILRLELFVNTSFSDPLEDARAEAADSTRTEFYLSTGADLLYQLSQSWSLALQYQHRRRDSNRVEDEFVENRMLLSITAGFSSL